jgi:hypothetical protein
MHQPLYKRASDRREGVGPEHPAVAIRLSNLATLYNDQGRMPRRESQAAPAISEKVFDPSI